MDCGLFNIKGIWEVMVMPGNVGAYHFWRAIIKQYTNNSFTEYTREVAHLNNSNQNIFKFISRASRKNNATPKDKLK